ncbi:MAG: CaiB/BaiF CoA transferase family protein [Aquabacterium sp.]
MTASSATSSQPVTGPLRGIRVLDLARVLAGPFSMQNLGDLGADIIKVERPGVGDESRHWGPPFMADAQGQPTRESAYFLSANRNKRSVAIDFTKPDGQALVRQLAETADVCVENFKVGDLARYGLDYATLSKLNPRLIYCSVTGFGQDGPYAERPGYDYLFQGLSGLMSVTGERDDRPGGGPQRVGVPIVDMFTGMYASVAILAALRHRDLSGEGQHLDISLMGAVMSLCGGHLSNYMISGKMPVRTGNVSPNIMPYGVFPCSDGPMIVASANQGQFRAFCKALGHPEWADDPRFITNGARIENQEVLNRLFSAVTVQRSRAEWDQILLDSGVPAGPINNFGQALAHPQVQHLQSRIGLPHPSGVDAPGIASPMRFSKSPVSYRRPPPMLGQHTREVLAELGLDEATLADLARSGAIGG